MNRFFYLFFVVLISAVFIGTMLNVPEPKEVFDPLLTSSGASGSLFLDNSGSIVVEADSKYRLDYASPADIVISAKEFPEPKISRDGNSETIEI